MDRLSGLDASFLYLETSSQLLHVCAVLELDGSTMPGGYSFDALKHALDQRTSTMAAFRRRLHDTTLNLDHPVWVDDPDFDIDHHLHRVALPAPAGPEQLAELAAHLAGQPMDRTRPLWDMWVVEGLASGGIAVIAKMHHASVDGVTGANLMSMLCGLDPDTAPEPDPDYRPAEPPHDLHIAADGLLRYVRRPLHFARLLPHTIDVTGRWIAKGLRGAAMKPPFSAPRTSFNGTVTGHRSVAMAQLDLATVKEIKQAFGTTVNDVVLALCAGAVRRYLADRDELPDRPLLALVPVSVHGRSDRAGRNKVSGMFATLRTDLADPVERLTATAATNAVAKDHHRTISASLLQDWAAFAAPTTFGLAVRAYSGLRLAERTPVVYNLVISNVPGPPMPLYFLGARITGMYPLGPVFHGSGLNITVLSNAGRVDVGIIACREQVPDPARIATDLSDALAELHDAARQARQSG